MLWDLLPTGARLGGAPANFAVFCARLGNATALLTRVGDDDFGRQAIYELAQPDLDLQCIQRDAEHPTGTVEVTFTAQNQPQYKIVPGVAWDFIEHTPALLEQAASADAVCYGTLAQRSEVSRTAIRTIVEAATCARVCDVNLRMPDCHAEVLRWSLEHATVIKLSDEELPTVFALLGDQPTPASPQLAACALLDRFSACELVATTLGAHGSMVTTRTGESSHPGFSVTVVDTVGAGDAFTAGLVHAYLRGASLAQMVAIGNLCGSYVASQPGATPILSDALLTRVESSL